MTRLSLPLILLSLLAGIAYTNHNPLPRQEKPGSEQWRIEEARVWNEGVWGRN